MLDDQYKSMWQYGRHKLHEIGVRGIFAGWSLSFLKDSLGSGVFFATFEYVKAQAYYFFVTRYYGTLQPHIVKQLSSTSEPVSHGVPVIRPHYALEPCFLMIAGVAASIAQQIIQHPLNMVQNLHYERLESLDHKASLDHSKKEMLRHYSQSRSQAVQAGGWRPWLFRGFLVNTIKQVPSTSAGLVIFELVRRKYGSQAEAAKIQKDGYDILLS